MKLNPDQDDINATIKSLLEMATISAQVYTDPKLGLRLGDSLLLKGPDAAMRRIAKLESALLKIKSVMQQPAGNRRFMQIAGPARQTINIINDALLP